jgi:hypothetical protein
LDCRPSSLGNTGNANMQAQAPSEAFAHLTGPDQGDADHSSPSAVDKSDGQAAAVMLASGPTRMARPELVPVNGPETDGATCAAAGQNTSPFRDL